MIKSDRRNEFLESLSVRSFDRNKEGTSTCYLVVLVMSFERKQKILQKRGLRSIWHHLNNDKIELHRILNRIFLLSLAEIVPVLCSSLQLTNVLTIRINNPPVPLITQMIICLHLHTELTSIFLFPGNVLLLQSDSCPVSIDERDVFFISLSMTTLRTGASVGLATSSLSTLSPNYFNSTSYI